MPLKKKKEEEREKCLVLPEKSLVGLLRGVWRVNSSH
jgi:hypothetical protein